MRLAIMQPYFLPYIGYYQLVAAVDIFVIYDNIKYTKKGWINRNRMLKNGKDATFTLPLSKASDFASIADRELSDTFDPDGFLDQMTGAYRKAPYLAPTIKVLQQIVGCTDRNLFRFLRHSLLEMHRHLGMGAQILTSSEINVDHTLKGQSRVLAICQELGARTYINAIGGTDLYSKEEFDKKGIELKFVKTAPFVYPQFGGDFVPWLSIIDVLMFNDLASVRSYVGKNYELI